MRSMLPFVAGSVLGLILSGCGDASPDDLPKDCETGLGKKANVLHAMRQGWRVDPKAGIMLDMTKSMFNLCKEHVSINPNSKTDMILQTSTTASEASSQISSNVGVKGSYGAFSAAVSASTEFAKSSKYNLARIDKSIISQIYKASLNTDKLFELMSKETRDYLTTAKPADIVDRYGEFYATEAGFGGIFRSVAMIEREEHQDSSAISAEAEASFLVGGIKVGTSTKSASNSSDAKAFWDMHIFGGDQKPWLSVSDSDGLKKAQEDWAASFDDANLYAMSMKLKPLWEVLTGHDDAQAKAIQDYLVAKWANDTAAAISFDGPGEWVPTEAQTKDYGPVVYGKCVPHTKWPTYPLNGAHDHIEDHGNCFCKENHGPDASVVPGSIKQDSGIDHTINCGEDGEQFCLGACWCISHLTCQWPPSAESATTSILV